MPSATELGLLVPRDLTSAKEGARFLALLKSVAPDFVPERWSQFEPIRRRFDQSDPAEAWSSPFLWTAQRGRIEGSVMSDGFEHVGASSIAIRDGRLDPDTDAAVRLLKQLTAALGPTFGYVHRINAAEFDGDGPGTVLDPGDGNYILVVSTYTLENGIPDLYWATVLGCEFVDHFAIDRLLTAPVHIVERLGESNVYLQLTADIDDMTADFPRIEATRQEAKTWLGPDSFFATG